MDWQLTAVLVLVAAATFYLLRQTVQNWFGQKASGCGGACACAPRRSEPRLIPSEELTLRRRPL